MSTAQGVILFFLRAAAFAVWKDYPRVSGSHGCRASPVTCLAVALSVTHTLTSPCSLALHPCCLTDLGPACLPWSSAIHLHHYPLKNRLRMSQLVPTLYTTGIFVVWVTSPEAEILPDCSLSVLDFAHDHSPARPGEPCRCPRTWWRETAQIRVSTQVWAPVTSVTMHSQ